MGQIPLLSAIKLAWGALALATLLIGGLAGRGRLPPATGVTAALACLGVTGGLCAWLTGRPLIAAGAAVLAIAGVLWWRHDPALACRGRRAQTLAFAVLAAGGIMAWVNFGTFHGPGLVHRWDTTHYLLGVRYFDELRYDGLYDCLVAADRADGLPVGFDGARPLRDLASDRAGTVADALDRIRTCPQRFTPRRFAEFQQDVRSLRAFFEPGMWRIITGDHGYNGSYAFTLMGRALAVAARATTAAGPGDGQRHMARQVIVLVLLDIACVLGVLAFVRWGFGLEAAALASLMLGLGDPWGYLWTGGCFGRHLWLLFAAGGMALLGRNRPAAAGAAIGVAVSLKLFPVLLLAGPVFVWLRRKGREAALPELCAFAAGAGGAIVLLAAAGAATLGSGVFCDFAAAIFRLQGAAKGNDLGLPVLAAWLLPLTPARTGEAVLSLALLVAAAIAWARAARGLAPWLSAALAPLVFLLSMRFLGYYGVFLVLLAPACRGSVTRQGILGASVLACLLPELLGWDGSAAGRMQTAALIPGATAACWDGIKGALVSLRPRETGPGP